MEPQYFQQQQQAFEPQMQSEGVPRPLSNGSKIAIVFGVIVLIVIISLGIWFLLKGKQSTTARGVLQYQDTMYNFKFDYNLAPIGMEIPNTVSFVGSGADEFGKFKIEGVTKVHPKEVAEVGSELLMIKTYENGNVFHLFGKAQKGSVLIAKTKENVSFEVNNNIYFLGDWFDPNDPKNKSVFFITFQ